MFKNATTLATSGGFFREFLPKCIRKSAHFNSLLKISFCVEFCNFVHVFANFFSIASFAALAMAKFLLEIVTYGLEGSSHQRARQNVRFMRMYVREGLWVHSRPGENLTSPFPYVT